MCGRRRSRPTPAPGAPLRVALAELAGADLFLTLAGPEGTEVVVRADPRATRLAEGDGAQLAFDPARLHLFDAETGRRSATGAEAAR